MIRLRSCCLHAHAVASLAILLLRSQAFRTAPQSRLALKVPPAGAQHFLLARHGQTTYNERRIFQGTINEESVLTEKGREQARELGTWIRDGAPAFATVFVSPLLRAAQTLEEARKVAANMPEAITVQDLREIELYEWQGLTFDEVQHRDAESFCAWKTNPSELRLGPGRLVVQDLWARADHVWREMRSIAAETAGPSLVVAHGSLGKALFGTALGLQADAFRHFELQNGEVVEVAFPADLASLDGTLWRRRHPRTGDWRGLEEEQQSLRNTLVDKSEASNSFSELPP